MGRNESRVAEGRTRLRNDEQFPTMAGPKVGGGRLTISDDLPGTWSVVLAYRGHW